MVVVSRREMVGVMLNRHPVELDEPIAIIAIIAIMGEARGRLEIRLRDLAADDPKGRVDDERDQVSLAGRLSERLA